MRNKFTNKVCPRERERHSLFQGKLLRQKKQSLSRAAFLSNQETSWTRDVKHQDYEHQVKKTNTSLEDAQHSLQKADDLLSEKGLAKITLFPETRQNFTILDFAVLCAVEIFLLSFPRLNWGWVGLQTFLSSLANLSMEIIQVQLSESFSKLSECLLIYQRGNEIRQQGNL